MTLLWIAALFLPLLLALVVILPGPVSRAGQALAPFAALPALILAFIAREGDGITISWMLLGTELQMDVTGQVFMLVTATVWLVAGLYARGYLAGDERAHRFWFFFLLSMSGNLGLIVAADVATFYLTFSLMTFSAYGLVVHTRTPDARRAGKVYLIMSLLGEMAILAGMFLTVWESGTIDLGIASSAVATSDQRNLIVALFLVGFGVKAGALLLHMWLPLAHPVAPTPASAVLSGCMIKAGLIGWLRFLPLEQVSMEYWGGFVLSMGLIAAFFGVIAGLLQDDPKTLLAYSSISQMGLITVAIGVGFIGTDEWDLTFAAIVIFVLHHGLAKGALFLGVGVADVAGGVTWRRRVALVGMTVAALALAGAPLTSGALAKTALKDAVYLVDDPVIDVLLTLTSVATTLLMARFILQVRATMADGKVQPFQPWIWLPWTALVALIGAISWILPWYVDLEIADPTVVTLAQVWSGVWPVVVGLVLFGGAGYAMRRFDAFPRLHIPPGDLIVVIEGLGRFVPRTLPEQADSQSIRAAVTRRFQGSRPALVRIEAELARWRSVGVVMMSLILIYLFLLGL